MASSAYAAHAARCVERPDPRCQHACDAGTDHASTPMSRMQSNSHLPCQCDVAGLRVRESARCHVHIEGRAVLSHSRRKTYKATCNVYLTTLEFAATAKGPDVCTALRASRATLADFAIIGGYMPVYAGFGLRFPLATPRGNAAFSLPVSRSCGPHW